MLLTALAVPGGAAADVLAKAAGGFVVSHDMLLGAPAERTYQALTAEVGAWWDADHSYSGRASNLTLDARAGGCFCERLDDGGSVEHMRVLFASPGKRLRLIGGLGPLQGMGASGPMDFELVPEGAKTRLKFRYTVSGFTPSGLEGVAEPVDAVLRSQLVRLAAYLEHGDPEAVAR